MIQRVNQQNFFWFPLKFESLWFTSASAMNVKCLKSKLSLERKFSNCCAKFVCLQADYFPLLHHTPPTACKSFTHRAPHLSKTQNRFIFVFVDFPSLAAINKKAKRDENLTYNTSGLCDGNLSRSCVLFCLILQMFSLIRSRQCALLLSFLCDVDTKCVWNELQAVVYVAIRENFNEVFHSNTHMRLQLLRHDVILFSFRLESILPRHFINSFRMTITFMNFNYTTTENESTWP